MWLKLQSRSGSSVSFVMTDNASSKARVFLARVLQCLKIRVRIAPQSKKVLVSLAGLGHIAPDRGRSSQTEMRERKERRRRPHTTVIQDGLKFFAGLLAFLRMKVRQASEVRRPELRDLSAIVQSQRIESFQRL